MTDRHPSLQALIDAAVAIRGVSIHDPNYDKLRADVLCAAQGFRSSDEEEAEFEWAKKREEEQQLFRVVYGRVFNDLENLQIEVQHAVESGWAYPPDLDALGCNWGHLQRILTGVKDCVANMRKYDLEYRP